MDISQKDNTQPISDDQELAKALAGVLPGDSDETSADNNLASASGLSFEETTDDPLAATLSAAPTAPAKDIEDTRSNDPLAGFGTTVAPAEPTAQETSAEPTTPVAPLSDFSVSPTTPSFGVSEANAPLDDIKLTALKELRPLIDKVELPAEEKFDTYLMLLRSTDDSTLIAPAHAAAQSISDEKRKAEALLEIIKEIDYLSRKDQPTA